MSVFEQAQEAVSFLRSHVPSGLQKPLVAIVCGSGLSGLADTVQAEPRAEYDYASIPHFPRPTGKLIVETRERLTDNRSCRTCRQTGFWAPRPEDPRGFHGWPRSVSLI